MEAQPHTYFGRWREQAREPALTILLVLEIIVIFVVIPHGGLALYALHISQTLVASWVVIVAIALIAPNRAALVATIVAGVVTAIADFFRYAWPSELNTLMFLCVVLLFLGVLTAVVGYVVFGSGRVTAHRIQGAVVIYLHLAVIFTYVYAIILRLSPGAFGDALTTADPAVGAKLLYFSFTTLTTVGYGDIAPVHHYARSFANLEAIFGQLYPATLLARIVTLQLAARSR